MRLFASPQAIALLLFVLPTLGADLGGSPIGKALELIDQLRKSVEEDGVKQEEAYRRYKNWCANQNAELLREVDEKKKAADRIAAEILEAEASISASATAIQKMASQVARDEAKQQSMKDVRDQEKEEFEASEQSLVDSIEVLDKAGEVLSEELKKNHTGIAFLQEEASAEETSHVSEMLMGLAALVDSAGLPARNAAQLAALLQSRIQQRTGAESGEEVGEAAAAAPSGSEGAFYSSHSQDLVDLIKKMQDEAEGDLQGLRSKEQEAINDFEQLQASLQRQMTDAQNNIDAEKASQQSYQRQKAKLEGDKTAALAESTTAKDTIRVSQEACMQSAVDEEKARNGRKKEIQTLEEAHRVVAQSTGFDEGTSFSLLQLSASSGTASTAVARRSSPAKSPLEEADAFLHDRQAPLPSVQEAVTDDAAPQAVEPGRERGDVVLGLLRRMAKQEHSTVLAQLATKISAAVRAVGGEDPLAYVRKMVQDMILKMEQQASDEMQEQAYCESETARSAARIELLNNNIRTGQTDIDAAASASAVLKSDVNTLREELTRLSQEQVEMSNSAEDMKKRYEQAKADLENGLDGIRVAMDSLKVYYGSQSPSSSFVQLSQPTVPQEVYASSQTSRLHSSPQLAESKAVSLMAASMAMDAPGELLQGSAGEWGDGEALAADSAQARAEAAVADAQESMRQQADDPAPQQDLGSQAARAIAMLQDSAAMSEPPPAPAPHEAKIEAGNSVVAILKVCESEIAENLAELDTQADDQAAEQTELLKQNQIIQRQHQLSVEYKTKEFLGLDTDVRKLTADLDAAKRELKPLQQYLLQVKERCEKQVTVEEVMRRRQKEIDGLREAQAVLEGESSFVQLGTSSPSFLQKRASHQAPALQPWR